MNQIVAIAYEFRIALLLDYHEQVAVYSSVACRIALAGDGQSHAFAYAGRDVDFDDFAPFDYAFATALVALILDDASFAAACGTYALGLHAPEKGILDAIYDTRTVAGGTSGVGRGVFGTRTAALVADDVFVDFKFLCRAACYLGKGQFNLYADVGTAIDTSSSATRTAAAESAVNGTTGTSLRS